ncbi:MAG: hypothetical protein MHPSP_003599, partial [Paramarteilia canceri]
QNPDLKSFQDKFSECFEKFTDKANEGASEYSQTCDEIGNDLAKIPLKEGLKFCGSSIIQKVYEYNLDIANICEEFDRKVILIKLEKFYDEILNQESILKVDNN